MKSIFQKSTTVGLRQIHIYFIFAQHK